MTKDLLLMRIAAIVSALNETNGTPESMLYIFCDMNMSDYEVVRNILIKAGYITIKSYYVTLTDDGKAMAQKIDAHLATNKTAQA